MPRTPPRPTCRTSNFCWLPRGRAMSPRSALQITRVQAQFSTRVSFSRTNRIVARWAFQMEPHLAKLISRPAPPLAAAGSTAEARATRGRQCQRTATEGGQAQKAIERTRVVQLDRGSNSGGPSSILRAESRVRVWTSSLRRMAPLLSTTIRF